jgi:paraquat-inducible protein A
MDDQPSKVLPTDPALRMVLLALLGLTVVLFVVGLFSPLLTLEKYIIIENTFSLVSALGELWQQGRYGLMLLIALFSIALPLAKFVVLFKALQPLGKCRGSVNKYLRMIHDYGRWSMLDVFVVALMIVAVKLGVLFEVRLHYGLYSFAAAILLTMIITAVVVRISEGMAGTR